MLSLLSVALLGLSQQAFTSSARSVRRPTIVGRAPHANPAAVVAPEPPTPEQLTAPAEAARGDEQQVPKPLADLSGATLNEEQQVTVTYSGSAASRERRVRRTRRPPKEVRFRFCEPEGYRRFSAFCTVDSIDLEGVIGVLTRGDFSSFGDRLSITSYTDVVHCRFQSSATAGESSPPLVCDAFLFPYGSAVLWGFSAEQEIDFLGRLSGCCAPLSLKQLSSDSEDDLSESEYMLYEVRPAVNSGGATPVISNNVIRLGESQGVFEKLAVSFAFAQSAKLAVFEAALEATTDRIRPIPVQLAERGRCKFSVNEVARLTGQVFLERNAVNLYSNILDTPEFFWEAEEFEGLYRRVNRYLDIEDRVRILNKRLDIVNDLLDSLSSQLEIRNSHRLEVIIIALITLEILLEVLKDVVCPQRLLVTGARASVLAAVAAGCWKSLRRRRG